MSASTAPATKWPARAAYVAAAIFVGASGAINVAYGWAKGDTLAGQIIWAAVAAAVAVLFALSWPALIRSLEARRWSAALISLVALLLAGSYSVTAALGSAAGGRANAATAETATTGARARAQAAYDTATVERDGLEPSRPVAEIEALLAAARPRCRIVATAGRRETVCAKPAPLTAEHGRAMRRAELEAAITKASTELANAGPARQANSDARTLARYLQAFGVNTTPEHLNDLLVLLAVLMIEAGGGLSLALGLALSAPPVRAVEALATEGCTETAQARTPAPNALPHTPHTETEHPNTPDRTPEHRPANVVEWLAQQGGRAQTSRRRLAEALGRSPSTVHAELCRLAAAGTVTMTTGPRGTLLVLRPN